MLVRCRKLESRDKLNRDFIDTTIVTALTNFPTEVMVDGTSAYITTYDRFGDTLSYEGYLTLDHITDTGLVFNMVYPDSLRLSDLTQQDFSPKGKSIEDIEDALEEAKAYREYDLDEDLSETLALEGHVEELEVSFMDLFDDLDEDLGIERDSNGLPILTSEEQKRAALDVAIDYLKREFVSYEESVSGVVEDIIDRINKEMDRIVDDLEDALSDAKRSNMSMEVRRRFSR